MVFDSACIRLLFCAVICVAPSSWAASSFEQVQQVVFSSPSHHADPVVQSEIDVYQAGQLPHYTVSASGLVVNGVNRLRQAAKRTLRDSDDVYPRLVKLVHANGICLSGQWSIDQPTAYSGYFKQGATGLWIGRASVSLTETKRGEPRGFAMAGKLFPTLDRAQVVPTANFFVADVLSGTERAHYLSTAMTNQPKIGFRWAALPMMFQVGRAFAGIDGDAGYRPVGNIAALGEKAQATIRAPRFLMIKPAASHPLSDAVDFRDELNLVQAQVPAWTFEIWVSDQAKHADEQGWQRIGLIRANRSVVSYGCDRQLHFAHPKVSK